MLRIMKRSIGIFETFLTDTHCAHALKVLTIISAVCARTILCYSCYRDPLYIEDVTDVPYNMSWAQPIQPGIAVIHFSFVCEIIEKWDDS